jgi:hypothetical protein
LGWNNLLALQKDARFVKGHDFSRADKAKEQTGL